MTVLLLAGTGEARRLARILSGYPLIASLAGATAAPADYPCETRIGGFGGPDGLTRWLTDHQATAIVDATHPFAVRISANAYIAAQASGVPLIRLDRPPWWPKPGETWTHVETLEQAMTALPPGARAFLATGRTSAPLFAARSDIWCALRIVDPPTAPYPGRGAYIVARPPFTEVAERDLFQRLEITHLVVKNAGGAAGRTKLDAAGALGVPIIAVDRPREADVAEKLPIEDIPAWLSRHMPQTARASSSGLLDRS